MTKTQRTKISNFQRKKNSSHTTIRPGRARGMNQDARNSTKASAISKRTEIKSSKLRPVRRISCDLRHRTRTVRPFNVFKTISSFFKKSYERKTFLRSPK